MFIKNFFIFLFFILQNSQVRVLSVVVITKSSNKKMWLGAYHSHNIAKLESSLYKGAALVVTGSDSPPSPGSISGHRFQVRCPAIRISGTSAGPWCGPIADETHTSTHQRITATPTRRHVPASHTTQHPGKEESN